MAGDDERRPLADAGREIANVPVPRPPATKPKRPQSAPAREPRIKAPARPPSASTWRGLRTHREQHETTRPGSAAAAAAERRPQSARPASASGSVRTGVVGNWGDGEERRFSERKAPVPLSARARLRPQSAAARLASDRSDARTRDPSDFARDECYTRLRKRYERSKGALGNSETGEPPATRSDWFKPPRANVHCPACLVEEMGLREDLEEARRQATADAEASSAQLAALEAELAEQRKESRSFELALLKKMDERDDENTALKQSVAELRGKLSVAERERDEMAVKLEEAVQHEAVWLADRGRLQNLITSEKNKMVEMKRDLDAATNIGVPVLAQTLQDLVITDSREREMLLRALLVSCSIEQQHELLSVLLQYLGERLDVSWFHDPDVPLIPAQVEHLTQWLLRLNAHSPRVILHGFQGNLTDIRALLVQLLQYAEVECTPPCTVGSVLKNLLIGAEMHATPKQLGLAPERLLSHTFGVSRQKNGANGEWADTVDNGTQTDGNDDDDGTDDDDEGAQKKGKRRRRRRRGGGRLNGRQSNRSMKVLRAAPIPIRNARRRVAKLFEKKCVADLVDDKKGHRRDELPEFVAEYMIHEFGLPSLANRATSQLTASVLSFSKRKSLSVAECEQLCLMQNPDRYDRRLRLFGRLCGMLSSTKSDQMSFHPSDAELILDILGKLYPLEQIEELYGVDKPVLPLDDCMSAVASVWADREAHEIPDSLMSELRGLAEAIVDRETTHLVKIVDVDALLDHVLNAWTARRAETTTHLEGMFSAHDRDGNGVLSFEEFAALIRELVMEQTVLQRQQQQEQQATAAAAAAASGKKNKGTMLKAMKAGQGHVMLANTSAAVAAALPSRKLLTRMYREAVEDTLELEEEEMEEDAISPAAFVATVQRYGLLAGQQQQQQRPGVAGGGDESLLHHNKAQHHGDGRSHTGKVKAKANASPRAKADAVKAAAAVVAASYSDGPGGPSSPAAKAAKASADLDLSHKRVEKGGLQSHRRLKRGDSMEDLGIKDIRGTAAALARDEKSKGKGKGKGKGKKKQNV